MADHEERHRKGQLIKQRSARAGLNQRQLAAETGVSERTIQAIYAGDTWGPSVYRLMERLQMTDDDFGTSRNGGGGGQPYTNTDLGREMADARVWQGFPDDVQVALVVIGTWLAHYPLTRRFEEIGRLTDYMRARDADRPDGP